MLKVLHFYKSYYPDTFGGVEQVIYQICEATHLAGVESTVLTLSPRGNIDDAMIDHHHIYYVKTDFELLSTPFSLLALKKFKQLANQADIIHYHFPYPFMDLLHLLLNIKKPTIVSYHSDIVKQKLAFKIYYPLMCRFLRSVDYIVASSPNYVETSPVLQANINKVKVIPYGLNKLLYPISSAEKLKEWRDKLGSDFYLFIGSFRYYKGLHILLDAVRKGGFPLVVIGSGNNEKEIKELAKDIKNIVFVGAVAEEDKCALLQLSYSIVFPSYLRSEAFGITLLEGAMYGKPLISCEIGSGTSYVNIHEHTGLVVPPGDSAALCEAMNRLWDNKHLASEYGINALNRFNKLFTAEKMMKNYMTLYTEVINKSRTI
ncbi:glycosyltransferase [Enterobacteriaceae bacterium ESL0689]|nr:glycosyltransferase [Enterobacteriaceae bacterium ESL0689]